MPKICQIDGCNNNQWGGGVCLFHQYKRKLATKTKREGKYTRIKRKSLKKALNDDIISFGFKDQVEMFNHIWETQPHICWLTKRPLPKKDIRMFAHVLRKGTYTYFKLNPDNIRLLLPTIHDLVDNFKEEYRHQLPHIDFNNWFKLQEEMREEYKEFKERNLLA
jgi:hypothetical protein